MATWSVHLGAIAHGIWDEVGSMGEVPVGDLVDEVSRSWSLQTLFTDFDYSNDKIWKFQHAFDPILTSLFHGGAKRHFTGLSPKPGTAAGFDIQQYIPVNMSKSPGIRKRNYKK